MAKIKLTIQELKQQKEALGRYERFLPTLQLKKMQLQMEAFRARSDLEETATSEKNLFEEIGRWAAVFGEDAGIGDLLSVDKVVVRWSNVAGVEIPRFVDVRFREQEYDLYARPPWVDEAVKKIKELARIAEKARVQRRQLELLEKELRTTVQRVNLFEKIMIPRTRDNIKRIQVYLADQQAAAVVRGKIAKAKAERKRSSPARAS
ncbi:MAG: V-type ATP synthase subunit D [Desulfatibacillaceae bacterium]